MSLRRPDHDRLIHNRWAWHLLASIMTLTAAAAVLSAPASALTPDPTNTISIDNINTADGEPARDDITAEPGDSYAYDFLASCSSIVEPSRSDSAPRASSS